jgi:hypothetical protein
MAVADKIEAKKKAKNVALQQLKQNQHWSFITHV